MVGMSKFVVVCYLKLGKKNEDKIIYKKTLKYCKMKKVGKVSKVVQHFRFNSQKVSETILKVAVNTLISKSNIKRKTTRSRRLKLVLVK